MLDEKTKCAQSPEVKQSTAVMKMNQPTACREVKRDGCRDVTAGFHPAGSLGTFPSARSVCCSQVTGREELLEWEEGERASTRRP